MAGAKGDELLAAIAADPSDPVARIVYADWLEHADDRRCHFVRQHLQVAPLPPDHPDRAAGERALSRHRVGLDPAWLAVIEPERRDHYVGEPQPACTCFNGPEPWMVALHREPQDTECDAWKILLDYIEDLAASGDTELSPRSQIKTYEQWRQIVSLPPTIAKLTQVTSIDLYGSYLVRIPREIGQMTNLVKFTPYTSYYLHWYPYEITRCRALRDSTVSTRALYGNYKFRPPFPQLAPATPRTAGPMRPCSVCDQPYEDLELHRRWISLRVATDVLPLLVNACSAECIARLPAPPERYLPYPHCGGYDLAQPRR
ncbi:MAG: TIGR02996 domain-containing protein [bacterium]